MMVATLKLSVFQSVVGTIKIKGIHINGLEVDLNHGLPILVVDGNMTKAQVNHFINDINDMKLDCKDEFIMIDEDKCLVVIPLNKSNLRIDIKYN